jgi:hypothetical protein
MNEIRKIVSDTYRQTIADGPYPTDFKKALRTHERIPSFFQNLVKEFSKPGLNPKRDTIVMATRDMTNLFVQAVHQHAEERLMSPLKKAMMKARQSQIKEMKKLGDALVAQGDANEEISQDKAGNKISKATVQI